jgi:hypothetical protein
MKLVVFDLDETLGYFVEFGIFWDSLCLYLLKNKEEEPTQEDFNNILDLYPEFLRPNIINILNYLKEKKLKKICDKIMIYTNNQGPRKWANHIISFFETKLNYKLFDQIIAAFKVNGKRIELCRSSHDKSYKDLIRCTKIPVNAEICFLDDNYFPGMANKNIYYINIKPYLYDLQFEEIYKRFLNSEIGKSILNKIKDEINKNKESQFINFMEKNIKMYNFQVIEKLPNENEIDKILSKKIMYHLELFFNKTNKNKTRKYYTTIKNKTRKKIYN